ncbi:cation:proton antiporter [Streptomyces sp. NPDC053048]|uniref:cation:proton antiporter n=1 Tax=Streptomyces sp. NPDC053048 TaxID=3365694 RepID=UPI0037D49BC6
MNVPEPGLAVAHAVVAPLGRHQSLVFLLQLALLLLLARGLGRLAARLGLPALVGELLAGVLLGPTVLGNAAPAVSRWLFPAAPAQAHLLDAVGLFGMLLLVAVTGAQFDARLLRRHGTVAARVSLAGLLVPLGLGIATGFVLPSALVADGARREIFALFLGVAMCVTAIPVIAKTLHDLDLLHRTVGQIVIAAALFDDAAGWLLLSLVSALAAGGGGGQVLVTTAWTAVFLAAVLLGGRPLARRLLAGARWTAAPGAVTAGAVVLVLFSAAATAAAGMEALFGAFVAGAAVLSLADPALLAPLRTLVMSVLAPVFLATVGLRVDLTALADPRVLGAGAAVLLVATLGKFLGAYLGARSGRLGHWEGMALGAGMNSRGMVEVVIAMAGLRLGVLNTAAFTVVVLVAIATSLTAPPLLRWATARIPADAEEHERKQRLAGLTPQAR